MNLNIQYLDPRSMAISMTVSCVLLAAGIRLTSHVLGSRRLGLGLSSAGLASAGVGMLLLMMRGVIPDWIGSTGGNMMILIGTGLMLAGMFQRLGRPIPWRALLLIWSMGLLIAIWLGLLSPHLRARVFIISGLLLLESLWLARLALLEKRAAHRLGMRLVAMFGMVFGAMMLTRMAAALLGSGLEAQQPTVLGAATVIVGGMALIVANLGLVHIVTGDLKSRLEQSANHDPLTQLLNRQGLRGWLNKLPPNAHLEVAMLDLDHLKAINDRYGHAVGDRAIQRVSTLVLELCGPTRQAVRMGGEEFALIECSAAAPGNPAPVPAKPRPVALSANFIASVEVLKNAVAAQTEAPKLSLSGGMATGTVQGFEACLRKADTRLYQAKARGRNLVVTSD